MIDFDENENNKKIKKHNLKKNQTEFDKILHDKQQKEQEKLLKKDKKKEVKAKRLALQKEFKAKFNEKDKPETKTEDVIKEEEEEEIDNCQEDNSNIKLYMIVSAISYSYYRIIPNVIPKCVLE